MTTDPDSTKADTLADAARHFLRQVERHTSEWVQQDLADDFERLESALAAHDQQGEPEYRQWGVFDSMTAAREAVKDLQPGRVRYERRGRRVHVLADVSPVALDGEETTTHADLLTRVDEFLQTPGLMPGRNAVSERLVRDLASALRRQRVQTDYWAQRTATVSRELTKAQERGDQLERELAEARDTPTRDQVEQAIRGWLVRTAWVRFSACDEDDAVTGATDAVMVVLRATAEEDATDG